MKLVSSLSLLATTALAQKINVSLTAGKDKLIEYGKQESLTCSWTLGDQIDKLTVTENEPVEVSWLNNGKMIFNILPKDDGYKAYPSFEQRFIKRTKTKASFNYTSSTSLLTLGSVNLKDAGQYKCQVKFREPKEKVNENGESFWGIASGSEKIDVEVFARPTVSLAFESVSFDIRAAQYDAWKLDNPVEDNVVAEADSGVEAEKENIESTEDDSKAVAEAVEEAVNDLESDTVAEESARRRRESDEAVVADETTVENGNDEAEDDVAVEADPEEKTETTDENADEISVEAVPEESNPSLDTSVAVPDVVSTQAPVLSENAGVCTISGAFPAPESVELVIGDAVVASVEDFSNVVTNDKGLFDFEYIFDSSLINSAHDGQTASCKAGSSKWNEASQNSETLDVRHLPDSVSVVFKNENGEVVESAFVGEQVTVECQSNGNPVGETSLTPAEPSFTVVKDATYSYSCAVNAGGDYSDYSVNSEETSLSVNYLETPVVTSSASGPSDEPVTLTCTADSEPEATFAWLKDGTIIENAVAKTLVISEPGKANYVCQATNKDKSKKSLVTEVVILKKCKAVKISMKKTPGNKGVVLTCEYEGDKCDVKFEYSRTKYGTGKTKNNKLTFSEWIADKDTIKNNKISCTVSKGGKNKSVTPAKSAELIKTAPTPDETSWLVYAAGVLVIMFICAFLYKRHRDKKYKKGQAPENAAEDV